MSGGSNRQHKWQINWCTLSDSAHSKVTKLTAELAKEQHNIVWIMKLCMLISNLKSAIRTMAIYFKKAKNTSCVIENSKLTAPIQHNINLGLCSFISTINSNKLASDNRYRCIAQNSTILTAQKASKRLDKNWQILSAVKTWLHLTLKHIFLSVLWKPLPFSSCNIITEVI